MTALECANVLVTALDLVVWWFGDLVMVRFRKRCGCTLLKVVGCKLKAPP
ncbi:MAG: hypothetical protein IPK08_04115 [Bacteroidetes bacterium]|nr:hypothetical protein [Bacteroidota bacterium]